jgi:hypothetical protein
MKVDLDDEKAALGLEKKNSIAKQNPQLQKALDIYIKEKHTQEECIGFIDGFEKAQRNMFSLDDMKKACAIGIDIACKEGENDFKPFENLINSLTK